MSLRLAFDANGWEDYQHWQANDRKTLKRVNQLIKDALRHPAEGIGKPEPLKYGSDLPTYSRRINAEDRLVYQLEDSFLVVIQARYHYEDH
jgi:toxin YoeB